LPKEKKADLRVCCELKKRKGMQRGGKRGVLLGMKIFPLLSKHNLLIRKEQTI
jgi:hypothetical protein